MEGFIFDRNTALPDMPLIFRYQILSSFFDSALMASSDVDQKYLGQFAKDTSDVNPFLSSMLFKILGLSVLLSKKLLRARKLRRLDTTRDTKSLQLYHHIIWLSREGLVITEQYIIPMVGTYKELKVLSFKLRASFYHIFVLFHNQPSVHSKAIPSFPAASPAAPHDVMQGGPVQQTLPPGLKPIAVPKSAASFLLPAIDYIPMASQGFAQAATLAGDILPGSHPLRVSVMVEYVAYLYDCLHEGDASRGLARAALRDVYTDTSGMEDDMFDDTAKLVVILDKMSRRGLGGSATPSAKGSAASPSTPVGSSSVPTGKIPPLPSPTSARGYARDQK